MKLLKLKEMQLNQILMQHLTNTVNGGSVSIIDYKFGEHRRQYERQLRRYADIWRRMGYADVKAVLWYVQTGEIQEVV